MWGLIAFIFFCILGLILVACGIGLSASGTLLKKKMTESLGAAEVKEKPQRPTILLRDPKQQSQLQEQLSRLNVGGKLKTLFYQAGLEWELGHFLFASIVAGMVGAGIGYRLNVLAVRYLSCILVGVLFFALPYLYVRRARNKRFAAFEEQLPEALDFLARSMRAGHAFSVSLEMLGEETPDPLGREFRTVFNEQNLGGNVETALLNLTLRVPILDVQFFASSVLLQRQTGGNLSEILMRLAHVIRERFRLKGQVRAAAAHGKFTAIILTILPFVLAGGLMIVAPAYIPSMVKDPFGKYMIAGAALGIVLGYYFMHRITNIKV
jgi:tight adherence protein B